MMSLRTWLQTIHEQTTSVFVFLSKILKTHRSWLTLRHFKGTTKWRGNGETNAKKKKLKCENGVPIVVWKKLGPNALVSVKVNKCWRKLLKYKTAPEHTLFDRMNSCMPDQLALRIWHFMSLSSTIYAPRCCLSRSSRFCCMRRMHSMMICSTTRMLRCLSRGEFSAGFFFERHEDVSSETGR